MAGPLVFYQDSCKYVLFPTTSEPLILAKIADLNGYHYFTTLANQCGQPQYEKVASCSFIWKLNKHMSSQQSGIKKVYCLSVWP